MPREGMPFGERDLKVARGGRSRAEEDQTDGLEAICGAEGREERRGSEVFGKEEDRGEGLFEEVEEMGRLDEEAGGPADVFEGRANGLGAFGVGVEEPDLSRGGSGRLLRGRRVRTA